MQKKILIVANKSIYADGGYKSRIEMELQILAEKYSICMFLPTDGTSKYKSKYCSEYYYYQGFFPKSNSKISKIKMLLKSNHLMKRAFKNVIKKLPDETVVYAEALGSIMTILPEVKKNGHKLIYDCHGAEAEEIKLLPPNIYRKYYCKKLEKCEKKVIDYASLIVTVSNKQYQMWQTNKPFVKLPMLPGSQFLYTPRNQKIRGELGIDNPATVFVYCGGNDPWQMCEETVLLYKQLEEQYSNSYFLIITNAVKYFKTLVDKHKITNAVIRQVRYDDVPQYLDAADYGFCIRRNTIINNVASPTKIMEYLSRNVKPIITDCIGDYSEELNAKGFAVVIDSHLKGNIQIDRNRGFESKTYVSELISEYKKEYISRIEDI